ncbi:cell adhesion molecule DSCAM-like [Corticium candelabrum]|uniref:cell adhesion molecule DSCAM-like n=1 Tax=Corticium candelabrum TaxID=121492 RepID=UPI002E2718B0|nr:cell adhesion molecule DSCAM-like [Corticium candelabrum]
MDNITFRCESTGIPVPQIWWFHDDQMQKAGEQGSSTLTITSAKKSDTGTYTCEGKNDAGVDMDTVVLQVQVSPDATTNLTAKEKTNISITLSWISGSENFSPINGYEVIYRQTGSSDWMIARNFNDGATTEQLVEGLMPLTDYDFRVRARNAIGEGEFSDIEKLITHPNALSLGPTELSYSEVKAISAKLTWKIVNESLLASNEGSITYYEMAYSYNNQSNTEYTNGAAPSGTLTGLLKGATYKVVVYARNAGPYRSPPSNKVSFTTDTTVPGKVTSLGTTEVTENSLNVKWEEPTDTGGQNVRIDGYRVEYRAGASRDFTIFQQNQQETAALIEGLIPRQEYTVIVTARNVNGFGVPDEIKRTTQTEALTAIELHPPETLRVDKDAPGTATCLTSSGAPPPPPVEWRVNNEVVSSAGSITVRKNVLTVAYAEDLNKAVIFCKVNDITSNKVTVDIPSEGKSSGLSGGAKAGIAIGVILGISIMVIILLIVMLRRKQSGGNVKSKSVKELSTAVEEHEREAIDDSTYEAIPGTGIPATPLYEDTVIRTSPHYQGLLVDNAAYKTTGAENRGNGN